MRRLLLVVIVLAVTLLRVAVARAGPYEEARAAEERYAFAEALTLYEQSPAFAARAAWLRSRSEGDFAPLRILEEGRRAEAGAEPVDPAAFEKQADAFPPGIVRVEAWVFAGDTYLRRGEPQNAIPAWRKAAHDPKADPVLAKAAIRSAFRIHVANDELDQAEADMQWFADPESIATLQRLRRRIKLHYASIALIALVLAAAVRAVFVARRHGLTLSKVGPVLAFAAFVSLVGAVLALAYERQGAVAAPFLWLGAALVPLLLAARAWSAAGGAPRTVRAVACAASVLAAAFLVLEETGQLDALGL